jgi:hypothetical protein
LSHASIDLLGPAKELHDFLESRVVKPCFSEKDLDLGALILRAIDKGLANSRIGLVRLTPCATSPTALYPEFYSYYFKVQWLIKNPINMGVLTYLYLHYLYSSLSFHNHCPADAGFSSTVVKSTKNLAYPHRSTLPYDSAGRMLMCVN